MIIMVSVIHSLLVMRPNESGSLPPQLKDAIFPDPAQPPSNPSFSASSIQGYLGRPTSIITE